MEREPTRPERSSDESYHEIIAAAFLRTGNVEHIDRVEVHSRGEVLWTHGFRVDEEHVTTALDNVREDHPGYLAIKYYGEGVVGYWIASGQDARISRTFRFRNEAEVRVVLEDAEKYLNGGRPPEHQ